MIFSWRRLRASRSAAKKRDLDEYASTQELAVPNHFQCPISLDLMKDPVTLSTGITYDRQSIETWTEAGNITCPITYQLLTNLEPVPNHTIREMIQDWCVENRSFGIERIPTPKTPISSHQVLEILSKLEAASRRRDGEECHDIVLKIMAYAKESERNKRCIIANGSGRVLSAVFESLSRDFVNTNVAILDQILSLLVVIISRLDEETSHNLSKFSSLQSLTWFLRFGSLSGRRNAVLALKAVVSFDQGKVDEFAKIEGSLEALVQLMKDPISPTTTKATLLTLYHMFASSESQSKEKVMIMTTLAELGLVQMLVEMLVDSEKGLCEKALGVLDGICSHCEGREKANENALTMPILVKKLLRVSELATNLSVSILWKLGKYATDTKRGDVIVEALQLGAFQKLLLLLQIGCDETTKERVTELLKSMNVYRNRVECVDSLDFKDLKRPF